ncbi:HAD hydrolase family protein, partial [Aeromonas salmonicida]|uniref:HAD hydrolase family protein n=1 Tax=Aeromonas salmonicida TaxID=645 RepID=UPI003D312456
MCIRDRDMDGTLLNPQGQISPRTHAAIAAARAKGVTVVLASGRPLEGMSRYLVELGLTGQDLSLIHISSPRDIP